MPRTELEGKISSQECPEKFSDLFYSSANGVLMKSIHSTFFRSNLLQLTIFPLVFSLANHLWLQNVISRSSAWTFPRASLHTVSQQSNEFFSTFNSSFNFSQFTARFIMTSCSNLNSITELHSAVLIVLVFGDGKTRRETPPIDDRFA